MARKRKGMLIPGAVVHIKRRDYRTGNLTVDLKSLFTIRSIGKRRCILDRIDPDTGELRNYGRGQSHDLYTEAQAESYNNSGYNSFYPTKWSQLLAIAGTDGWDPIENY